jgi:hypothetical protein
VRHDAPTAQPRHKGTGVVTAIAPERTHAYPMAPRRKKGGRCRFSRRQIAVASR